MLCGNYISATTVFDHFALQAEPWSNLFRGVVSWKRFTGRMDGISTDMNIKHIHYGLIAGRFLLDVPARPG